MFEIENCYRIIFEAMLEPSVPDSITEGLGRYTKAGIALVAGTGRILSHFGMFDSLFPSSVEKKHLILDDYRILHGKKEVDGKILSVAPVSGDRIILGHIVFVYEREEEKEAFEELGLILSRNLREYFDEIRRKYLLNQSPGEYMIGWTLFEDDARRLAGEKNCPEGEYIVASVCKTEENAGEIIAGFRAIWGKIYFYEDSVNVFLLLYQLTEKDAQSIYTRIESEKLRCCVSEPFSELFMCRGRKNVLKRIALVKEPEEAGFMRREKEWALKGLYTYAAPLIEKAGLNDYCVGRLMLEDEKNHTELYHTLKVYLLCENNVTAAARALHIHRNTLVYRLKQIREYMDADMNDYETSRELLAFMMMNDVVRKE